MIDTPVFNLGKVEKCWGDGCTTLGINLSSGPSELTDYILTEL